MSFNPTDRILLENSPRHLNKLVVAELSKLDARAKEIRDAGKEHPVDALRGEVANLKMSISRATVETLRAIDGEIATLQEQWVKARDSKPQAEIAELMRVANEINGMSNAEIESLSQAYATNEQDLSATQLNAIRQRLRESGSDWLESVNSVARELHTDEPWLQSGPASELVNYKETLNGLTGGEVAFESEDVRMKMNIEDLIDYSGELDSTAS